MHRHSRRLSKVQILQNWNRCFSINLRSTGKERRDASARKNNWYDLAFARAELVASVHATVRTHSALKSSHSIPLWSAFSLSPPYLHSLPPSRCLSLSLLRTLSLSLSLPTLPSIPYSRAHVSTWTLAEHVDRFGVLTIHCDWLRYSSNTTIAVRSIRRDNFLPVPTATRFFQHPGFIRPRYGDGKTRRCGRARTVIIIRADRWCINEGRMYLVFALRER